MRKQENTDLIIGIKASNVALLSDIVEFNGFEFKLEPLGVVPASLTEDKEAVNLYRAEAQTDNSFVQPWDLAHYFKEEKKDLVSFSEPDLNLEYVYQDEDGEGPEDVYGLFKDRCQKSTDPLDFWSHPDPYTIWHLDNAHSGLKEARESVMNGDYEHTVRIAHFDTGYSNHIMKPEGLQSELGLSFIKGELRQDASDRGTGLSKGHGTGTLGILAGGKLNRPDLGFNDYLGGAPFAKIVPFRISQWVVLIRTSELVAALDHVINTYDDPATRCDVITMSMGGLGTWALTTKINELYEKGIFMVSATGNNMSCRTPSHVIFPARYKRTVGAAGITYDQSPYYKPATGITDWHMQGNFGPDKAMHTVMAAYSPNMPWSRMNCGDSIRLSGGGTSSATPQIAAAAAIYIRRYRQEIDQLEGWKKVEAIKNALFRSAEAGDKKYFGRGVLKAHRALAIRPDEFPLQKEDKDRMLFPITWPALAEENTDPLMMEMIEIEIVQLIQASIDLQQLITSEKGEELEFRELSKEKRGQFMTIILEMPQTSQVLKNFLIKYQYKLLF